MVLTGFILDEIVAVRLLLSAPPPLFAYEMLAGGIGWCLPGG
jgi:hypothetical protein